MKAIDFATRFTAALMGSPASLHENAILCAMAAGLDNRMDIATQLQSSPGTVATALHKLTKRGLTQSHSWLDDGTPLYRLTDTGRTHVATLLSFLNKH